MLKQESHDIWASPKGSYLRIVYSDKTLFFEELLDKDGSITIHTRNLQLLVTDKNLRQLL